jgi:hypothetical protein
MNEFTYDFLGKKPSRPQLLKKALEAQSKGFDTIELYWGENAITLIKRDSQWLGLAWIKDISGDEIAASMNGRAI